MEFRKLKNLNITMSVLGVGTWAFGGDKWWGCQNDRDSSDVLCKAIESGINLVDTAPAYGKGRSEELVGRFLKKEKMRDEVVLATKLGLSWKNGRVFHNLKRKRMFEEIEESMRRLQTDYIDIYQVHWPDPDTPIKETAETMHEFYQRGLIRAIGVSNYSVRQIQEFMEYSPLHILQPPYNMFKRDIEKDIIPLSIKHDISIISYIPLHSAILTGKFFFREIKIPSDLCRKDHMDLKEPLFSINKEILEKLRDVSLKYNKTLAQLVLNWTYNRRGITSILVGARNTEQLKENLGSLSWKIKNKDLEKIEDILREREERIKNGFEINAAF